MRFFQHQAELGQSIESISLLTDSTNFCINASSILKIKTLDCFQEVPVALGKKKATLLDELSK